MRHCKQIIEISIASKKDIPSLKELWKDCFTEDSEYLDHLFKTLFNSATVYILKEDNSIAASLFLINIKFINEIDNYTKEGKYLYGVCTLKKFRNKRYAKKLIEHIITLSENESNNFILCVPASPPLFSYYRKIGFTIDVPRGTIPFNIPDIQDIKELDLKIDFIYKMINETYPIRFEFDENVIRYMITSKEIYNPNIYIEHKAFGLVNALNKDAEIPYNKGFIGFEL